MNSVRVREGAKLARTRLGLSFRRRGGGAREEEIEREIWGRAVRGAVEERMARRRGGRRVRREDIGPVCRWWCRGGGGEEMRRGCGLAIGEQIQMVYG